VKKGPTSPGEAGGDREKRGIGLPVWKKRIREWQGESTPQVDTEGLFIKKGTDREKEEPLGGKIKARTINSYFGEDSETRVSAFSTPITEREWGEKSNDSIIKKRLRSIYVRTGGGGKLALERKPWGERPKGGGPTRKGGEKT